MNLSRRRPLGPGEKALVALLGLVVLAGLVTAVVAVGGGGDEKCASGLEERRGECIGVAEEAFEFDPEIAGVLSSIADENDRVREEAEEGEGRIPYMRIALTMPFTSDDSSAMSMDQIKRAVAGAHAAQLAANARSGPKYQLLPANIGRDMTHWRPVLDQLTGMSDSEAPLIAAVGLPSSTSESKAAIKQFAEREIPSVGPVITASDMNANHFFKTSPSNTHFAEALKDYLDEHPGSGDGYLVVDEGEQDVYSRDLETSILRTFEEEYHLRENVTSFVGTRGDKTGTPQLFRIPVQKICNARVDTVFYAGRDEDLPALLRELASSPECGYRKPLRIVKVAIGFSPEFREAELTDQTRRAGIVIVNASPVDPQWQEDDASAPHGFAEFSRRFAEVEREQPMGDRPLDDGYAIMYYDAVTAISDAAGVAFEDVREKAKQGEQGAGALETQSPERVRKDVVNTLLNMNPDRRGDGASCNLCVEGASGTFGFDRSASPGLWPVCKSVHVLEHPAPSGEREGKTDKIYRTAGETFSGGVCPKGG